MNDELQKQLAQMLASLQSTAQNAASWTAAQIPPLVQERIAFGRVWETWSVFGCVFFGAFFGAIACGSWRRHRGKEDWDDPKFASIAIPGACCVATIVAALFNMHDFVLVWFAPRLYVVEWLKTLVTK